MVTKEFSPTLYNDNDAQARDLVIKVLRANKIPCDNNEDLYGVDIKLRNGGGVEVERRHNWKGGGFPYSTVHIPGRKTRLLKDGNTHYAFVSKDMKRVGLIHKSVIAEYLTNLTEVSNKYVEQGEEFIDIPTVKCQFFNV
jgi:hypothetical protein